MAKVKIACDSSAGLTDEEIQKYNITIIPLSVMIDDTVYVERETITNEQFPAMMKAAKALLHSHRLVSSSMRLIA